MEPEAAHESTELAIDAQGLVRRFGTVEAVANITLQIRKGEFFSLLGPSGCGKTTLLRLIAGLESPDAGTLKIGGRDAAVIPAHQRPVNTVFQSYALFPHMTVWDNVAFGLKMKRVPAAEIDQRVESIMKLVEIDGLTSRRPAQLSGGQKQRVALARAVVNEPEVLLLDEPLGALDLKLRKQLQLELHQLQRRLGITFVYVTHDQEEALVMSHRIGVMNDGRLEQVDAGERLYERPRTRFVARFIGSCNFLTAVFRDITSSPHKPGEQLLDFDFGSERLVASIPLTQRRPAPGTPVTLALRPEKIRLSPPGVERSAANAVRGVIEDLVYSGAETTYHLRILASPGTRPPRRTGEGATEKETECAFKAVALNARVGHQGFGIGETVLCCFGEDALILLDE